MSAGLENFGNIDRQQQENRTIADELAERIKTKIDSGEKKSFKLSDYYDGVPDQPEKIDISERAEKWLAEKLWIPELLDEYKGWQGFSELMLNKAIESFEQVFSSPESQNQILREVWASFDVQTLAMSDEIKSDINEFQNPVNPKDLA